MRRHFRHRLWARDGDPGLVAWMIGSISLLLPLVGLLLCLFGGAAVIRDGEGWIWFGLGVALIVSDVIIDFVWAHPSVSESDQPLLNRPFDRLTARIGIVAEPIENGRGKIRIGDTIWVAEGPDLPAGVTVRVAAVKAQVLVVEQTDPN